MSLTVGRGPFGHHPAGRFDFTPPRHVVYVEPFGRRVRALRGGDLVVDTLAATLLHETGSLPVLYFRDEEVRSDLLEPRALRRHAEHPGFVSIAWDAVDAWLEEDEEMLVHVRDPYHRIEVRRSSRRVCVAVAGETLAESSRPRILFETGLPARYYLPREDVRLHLLEPHGRRTRCAYKGIASHWSARTPEGLAEAVAWSYEQPDADARDVAGLIAFYNERVDLDVDGAREERPRTQWHPRGWGRGAP